MDVSILVAAAASIVVSVKTMWEVFQVWCHCCLIFRRLSLHQCPHVKTPPTRTSVTPERIRTQSTESGFHIVQPIMFSMLFLGRSFNMIFVMMVESWSFFRACSASPHMIILKCPACPKIQVFQATVLLKLVQSSISQLFNKSDQVSHCKAEELRGARFPKIHFVFGYFPE